MGDCRGLQHSWRVHLFLFLLIGAAPPLYHSCHFGFVPFAETKPETRYRQAADWTTQWLGRIVKGAFSQHLAQRCSCCCCPFSPRIYISPQSAPSKLVSHEERFADTESGLRRIIGKKQTIALWASSVQAAVCLNRALYRVFPSLCSYNCAVFDRYKSDRCICAGAEFFHSLVSMRTCY